MTSHPSIWDEVINEASVENILQLALGWVIPPGILLWVCITHREDVVTLFFLTIVIILVLIFVSRPYYAAKTMIVTHDGIIFESWISRIFHWNQTCFLPWDDIRQVIYRETLKRTVLNRMTDYRFYFYNTKGVQKFFISSTQPDIRKTQHFKNLLIEKLGSDKIRLVKDKNFRLTKI